MREAVSQPSSAADIGSPARVTRGNGAGPVVLVCEHASHAVPMPLADRLAPNEVLLSHAGWDPGAEEIAQRLSRAFDAPLVSAAFSRLVYDLNRPPNSPDAIRSESEIHKIPGNCELTEEDLRWRTDQFYTPFHSEIDALLERRRRDGQVSVLVTIHTFAPIYFGRRRDVEYGILHDADARLADMILDCAPAVTARCVRRNEPYGPGDGVTHTLAHHGLPRGLLNVMIEVRNDLAGSKEQQDRVACELTNMLRDALTRLGVVAKPRLDGASM